MLLEYREQNNVKWRLRSSALRGTKQEVNAFDIAATYLSMSVFIFTTVYYLFTTRSSHSVEASML